MRGWQANKKRTLCVACNFRALPETEIPPALRGGYLLRFKRFFGIVGCDVCEGFFP